MDKKPEITTRAPTANGKNGFNGNSKKREETCARIIKAIGECNGLLTLAAKKAGVGYTTINRYAHDFPSVHQAVIDAKETMLDFAEGKLYQKIKDGDNTAIIFYLKTQGKARGYIERQEFANPPGESFRHDHNPKGKLVSLLNRYATREGQTESGSESE